MLTDELERAVGAIRASGAPAPDIALVLGSGLGPLAEAMEESVSIPYADIPGFRVSTAPGHAGRLVLGRLAGRTVAAMAGRVHMYEGYSAQEVVLSRDPEKAARIREEDDAMDDLHRHLFSVLMDREWKHGVAAAVDVTLLGRFYERFADHAVQVAKRIIFQATGRFPVDDAVPTSN